MIPHLYPLVVKLANSGGCRGKELVIKAVGTVKETIEEGAYIELTVKYGLIRLISTKADLCEQIKNVDLECPIEKGILSIVKTVELPEQIPPVSRLDARMRAGPLSMKLTLLFPREHTPFTPMCGPRTPKLTLPASMPRSSSVATS